VSEVRRSENPKAEKPSVIMHTGKFDAFLYSQIPKGIQAIPRLWDLRFGFPFFLNAKKYPLQNMRLE
jgi:hypothetical protein